ncbi:transient receptor potential cation channel protein painless-like [Tribolium madens]|uniref:transient receptor potential cation channel protein painless-like n=1 Tax=Tribolium madens TaxID=41895 RepID=UPI001CF72B9A|nr:transient receptor potential cation channel protein painless-like [Tribolium madens]
MHKMYSSVSIEEEKFTENKENIAKSLYRLIQGFSKACDDKSLKSIRKLQDNNKILKKCIVLDALDSNVFATNETKNKFKHKHIDILLNKYEEIDKDGQEVTETDSLFFTSAQLDLDKLKKKIIEMNSTEINQTRFTNSVLIFTLKYGNFNKDNFVDCIEELIKAGVDINKCDLVGSSAIDYVADLYEENKGNSDVSEKLKTVAKSILSKTVFKNDNKVTKDFLEKTMKIDVTTLDEMDDKTKLFYCVVRNKLSELQNIKDVEQYLNCNNEENTLLQIACKRRCNLEIIQWLLNKGADQNLTTPLNLLTPLELAATHNSIQIFEEILKKKGTDIKANQYNNLVKWQKGLMKSKIFELFLESNNIDVTFQCTGSKNTPLHYAVLCSYKTAIQNLLKRGASLTVKNNNQKCPLDIIDSVDLDKYFDYCLALDNYNQHFANLDYKINIRFTSLINDGELKESKVFSKIGNRGKLEPLLTHPLIHVFILLKWHIIRVYFWVILLAEAILYSLSASCLYNLPHLTTGGYTFCVIIAVINTFLKLPIFLYCQKKDEKVEFLVLQRAPLHAYVEVFLILTIWGSFIQNQFRAFVFTAFTVSFLLTAGYHPKLSKWSVMLQKVFKTFTILLLFFSLIIVGFSTGFQILFSGDGQFKNFFTAIFKTYIMATGQVDIDEKTDFDSSGIAGYLMFLLFAMSMSLVIVNFWTGVAVTDIERIERSSVVNGFRNVIIFMSFIEWGYSFIFLKKLRAYIPSPLLFSDENKGKKTIDFYVNKDNQFDGNKNSQRFPKKIDRECFYKIQDHYFKCTKEKLNHSEIMSKLKQLSDAVSELKKTEKSRKCKCFEHDTKTTQKTEN